MVYIDTPYEVVFRERTRRHSHLTADRVSELHAFARTLGIPREAFQYPRNRPHYDVFDHWITRARQAGALLVPRAHLLNLTYRARWDEPPNGLPLHRYSGE
jgi:hypothetical protein